MHVADMRLGILGANGIVGAGIPIALGSALGHALHKRGNVAVVFFGDGAMAEGVLHETLNLAALWKLPLLLVCENNGWSEFSPTSQQFAPQLKDLAAAFGITYLHIDGADVDAVAQASQEALANIREGRGAYILECATHRVRGHYEGDPQKYRAPDELEAAANADPIRRSRSALQAKGVSLATIESLEDGVRRAIDAAIERARSDHLPTFEEAFDDVYTAAIDAVQGEASA